MAISETDTRLEGLCHILDELAQSVTAQGEETDIPSAATLADDLIVKLRERFDHRIARLKQSKNGLLAVTNLPSEVLVRIVSLSLLDLDTNKTDIVLYYKRLLQYRAVCRLWSNHINSESSLWCFFHPRMRIRLVRLALSNSRQFPITVSYDTGDMAEFQVPRFQEPTNDEQEEVETTADQFTARVLAHRERWKVLRLSLSEGTGRSGDQINLLSYSLPTLQRLEVFQNSGFIEVATRLEPLEGSAPSLRSVTLQCILQWKMSTQFLRNLESISIRYVKNIWGSQDASILIEDLRHLLAASPNLKSLELGGMNFRTNHGSQSTEEIRLPMVQHLKLLDFDGESLETLSMVLVAPKAFTLDLKPQPGDNAIAFGRFISRLDIMIFPASVSFGLGDWPSVRMDEGGTISIIRGRDTNERQRAEINSKFLMQWNHTQRDTVQHIKLEAMSPQEACAISENFTNVRSLTVPGEDLCLALVEDIHQAEQAEGKPMPPLFPGVTDVYLVGVDLPKARVVLPMLRARSTLAFEGSIVAFKRLTVRLNANDSLDRNTLDIWRRHVPEIHVLQN